MNYQQQIPSQQEIYQQQMYQQLIQQQQMNNMKMFTYIMMAMIIFMGFTLVSAMGVYWFVGALFSICQTLIVDRITTARAKKKGR